MIVPHLLQTAGEFSGDWALPAANPTAIDKRRASFDELEFTRRKSTNGGALTR
jgi:hypothetical protein